MTSKIWAFSACALALGSFPCAAQDSAGVTITHGADGDVVRGMLAQMGATKRTRDNCWNLGCLLIVNETRSYDVVGFYVDTAKSGAAAKWSKNQFGAALQPMKVTLRFKTGGGDACNIPVRLVLREHEGMEEFEVSTTASLCSTPHQDTLLRIKAAEPRVILEEGK